MKISDILNELTFMGSQCTKDCSGHRAGYKWSLERGGQQAASRSNSFNNGAAIGVQQTQRRPQGGGKIPGFTSQTANAVRKRTQRLQQAKQLATTVPSTGQNASNP
jgi:hypothetical protein